MTQDIHSSTTLPQRVHRALFDRDVASARAYDLLTNDHPYRWYHPQERSRFNPLLRGLTFVGIMIGSMIVLIIVFSIIAVAIAPNAFSIYSNSGNTSMEFSLNSSAFALSSPIAVFSMLTELFAAVIAYLVVVFVMEGRRPPLELDPKRAGGALAGMASAFVCIAVCIGVIAVFGGYRIVGFDAGYQPWADLLTLGLTAGIAEEIMMRGILLRLLEEWLGSWGAVALSALVFGLVHVGNKDGTLWGGIAIAIEAGLLFGAIYLATRSLWWCMGFHFMWNIAEGPIFGSIVSGNGTQRSWLIAQWNGPEWLTGGTFGLEASIVPVIVLGSLAVVLLIHLQHHGRMIAPSWIRKRRLFAAAQTAAPATTQSNVQ